MQTLTLAGHETTASTLSWLLYELAHKPKFQARVRDEIRAARAQVSARGDSRFNMDDLDGMTTVVNAIKVCTIQSLGEHSSSIIERYRKLSDSTLSYLTCTAWLRRTTLFRFPTP